MTWATVLIALNWRHLGVDACLHWDAEDGICTDDPMPAKAVMLDAGRHVFDLSTELGTTDPATLTARFDAGARPTHVALETVRRYYSQVAFVVGRSAFALGRTPIAAVWCFQLAAALMMSFTWAAATVHVWDRSRGRSRLVMTSILVAAATSPVGLSLARQVLTETVGLPLMVVTLALASRASRWWVAVFTGVFLFLTVRARYSLGPTAILLLPLALPLAASHSPRATRANPQASILWALVGFTTVAILDAFRSGPMLLPWVYDRWMVQPTRLYFHAIPPYHLFAVALYENAALWLLPAVVMIGFPFSGRASDGECPRPSGPPLNGRRYARFVLAAMFVLLLLTARQQVGYQGRHLIPLTGGCVVAMALSAKYWRPRAVWPAGVLIGFNLLSTFAIQPYHPLAADRPPSPLKQWTTAHSILRPVVESVAVYYDWADDYGLRERLLATRVLEKYNHPLLWIDPAADERGRLAWLARRFDLADVQWAGSSHRRPRQVYTRSGLIESGE